MIDSLRRVSWLEVLGRNRRWLFLSAVVIIVYLCYSLILLPAWQHNQEARAELEQHKTELTRVQGILASTRTSRQSWVRVEEQYGREFFAARNADDRDIVILAYFYRIQRLAGEAGVQLQDINQGAEEKTSSSEDKTLLLTEHPVTIRFLGTYENLVRFMGRLATAPRLARLDTAVISAGDTGADRKLHMVVKLSLLFYVLQTGEHAP